MRLRNLFYHLYYQRSQCLGKGESGQITADLLCTPPQAAESDTLTIGLMDSFFAEQFRINDSAESLEYWEVYDRTTNVKIDNADWSYDKEKGSVSLSGIIPFISIQ